MFLRAALLCGVLLPGCASNRPPADLAANNGCAAAPWHASAQGPDDLAASFSFSQNPSIASHFSYGWQQTRDSEFRLYAAKGVVLGAQSWQREIAPAGDCPGQCNLPIIWKNDTCGIQELRTLHVTPGRIVLHPGKSGERSVVRWTCPADGKFRVGAWFEALDDTTADVSVRVSSTPPDRVWAKVTSSQGVTVSETVNLHQGEVIDFSVGFGENGAYECDSTGAQVVISRL